MTKEHPNIILLSQLDQYLGNNNLAGAVDLFTDNFVWHFFNPQLPHIQGDYAGVEGLQTFFQKLAEATGETFHVEPISITPIGDELVVTHVQDTMKINGQAIALDAVVVWRIVDGNIAEAWDIPAVHTLRSPVAIA